MKRVFRPLLLLAASSSFAIAVGGCEARQRDTGPDVDVPPSVLIDVNLDQIVDYPDKFANHEVRVIGEVDDVSRFDRAFVLQGDNWLWPDEVLVVSTSPILLGTKELQDDEDVIVVGKVYYHDTLGLRRDLGRPISDETLEGWQDKPVILARQLTAAYDDAQWVERGAEPATR